MSRWLGPIAGLAAGLGLAALLSHFGLPEGLGSFLLLALLVIAARGPRAHADRPPRAADSRRCSTPAAPSPVSADPVPVRTRPPSGAARQRQRAGLPAAAGTAPADKPFPPGFDAAGFARQAKLQFTRLQAAYDTGDRAALADVMTPEMFAEVARELEARGDARGHRDRLPRRRECSK